MIVRDVTANNPRTRPFSVIGLSDLLSIEDQIMGNGFVPKGYVGFLDHLSVLKDTLKNSKSGQPAG